MIPVQLTLEGLYSYRQRQTIDFASLTSAGLFGIFGAVGSGKSAILEAITYALYGETERLNQRDKRGYNMMNLKSNRAYVEFDFENHEGKRFRATRELRRNSRNFEDVKSPLVSFYTWENGSWFPLEHTDAERIVGLSYANFKRTIIIPQGQFKEFLELSAMERTNMMKEIFNLHRYDLQERVSSLNKQNDATVNQLKGKLQAYEAVSEEEIELFRLQQKERIEQQQVAQQQHDVVSERFRNLKLLKEASDTLTKKKQEIDHLNREKTNIDDLKLEVELYERYHKVFHQLLIDLDKNEQEINAKQTEKGLAIVKMNTMEQTLKEYEAKLLKITPYFEQLADKKVEENDLNFILQVVNCKEELTALNNRTRKGEDVVKSLQDKEREIEEEMRILNDEKADLLSKKMDSDLMMQLSSWYQAAESMTKALKNQKKKVDDKEQEIQQIKLNLKEKGLDTQTYKIRFAEKLALLNEVKANFEKEKEELVVQQKLSAYSSELHPGQACPLCGSIEHPHVVGLADVSEELRRVVNLLKVNETEQDTLRSEHGNVELTISGLKTKEIDFEREKSDFLEIKAQIEVHNAMFSWTDFDATNPEHFKNCKKESLEIEKQLERKNNQFENLRKLVETSRKNIEIYRNELEKIRVEAGGKQAQMDTNMSNIRVLKFDNYRASAIAEINSELESLQRVNREVEDSHRKLTDAVNRLTPEIASQKTRVDGLQDRLTELKVVATALRNELEANLEQEHLDNTNPVREVLQKNTNVAKARERIENFTLRYKLLQNEINNIEEKLREASFDNKQYYLEEENWKQAVATLKEKTGEVAKLDADIARLSKSLLEKQQLLQDLEKVEKRAENLKTLFNLFKASGFVQYVSSIYLSQLCDHANLRFHRMTRNQLSLQLNENNDFEIIDYLNEGRSRSVKTLSGGQSFQVSLSLALALAESVQTNAKADKNFFFIDEGFGTQDADSVNIVLETLLSLNKEHKIVGIISHVEELKERMPLTLTVVKDPEKGSLIQIS